MYLRSNGTIEVVGQCANKGAPGLIELLYLEVTTKSNGGMWIGATTLKDREDIQFLLEQILDRNVASGLCRRKGQSIC